MASFNYEGVLLQNSFFNPPSMVSLQRCHVSNKKAKVYCFEVIGNDNAEKIQILPATIARTDRNCPEYHDNYEDENTFYAGLFSCNCLKKLLNVCRNAVKARLGGVSIKVQWTHILRPHRTRSYFLLVALFFRDFSVKHFEDLKDDNAL